MKNHTWLIWMATLLLSTRVLATPETDQPSRNYNPTVRIIQYQLGETIIPIKIYAYGNATDIVMINVHSNESTSVKAAMSWLRKNGGMLIKIENGTERNIVFKIGNDKFQFDPNHIFSKKGILADFELYKKSSPKAIAETGKFAKKILSLFPLYPSCIIALHNNFPGGFGIDDYLPTGERAGDAANVYKNADKDPDDIFFTTDSRLFDQLSGAGYNSILQDVSKAKDDGSLSMHYHHKNIRYLNCETEHEKLDVYETMITDALACIERCDNDQYLYTFKCTDTALMPLMEKGIPVYADSVYMGEVKSTYRSKSYKKMYGKMALKKGMLIEKNMKLSPQIQSDGTFTFSTTIKKGLYMSPSMGAIELSYHPQAALMVEVLPKVQMQPIIDSTLKN